MISNETTLFLSFPQWQGAGAFAAMGNSSGNLHLRLPQFDWRHVPVARLSSARAVDGIHGKPALLVQMHRAFEMIRSESPARIFVLGGDCSVEIAPVASLLDRYGDDLAVVWLDAHPDLSAPETSLTANLHGMVLLTLLGEGAPEMVAHLPAMLKPEQVVLAGARECDVHEIELLEILKLKRVSCSDLEENPDSLVDAVRSTGCRRVFVHLDLDVLDPEEFASVAFPTRGGPKPSSVLAALRRLRATFDVVGAGVTEFVERKPGDGALVAEIINCLVGREADGPPDASDRRHSAGRS